MSAVLFSVALVAVSAGPGSAGVSSSTPSSPELTAASEDGPKLAAARAYAAANDVGIAAADIAVTDQETVVDLVNDLGLDLGVDADVWVDQEGSKQEISIRTEDENLADSFRQLDLSEDASVSVIAEQPIADQVPEVTDEVEAKTRSFAPGIQGLYVRTSDGALVIETTDEPANVDEEAIGSATGFANVEISQVEAAGDHITLRGGVGLGSCTAAFTAKYGSYVGYFSAAHCGPTQNTYANTAGTGTYVRATVRKQVHNANADIAFFSIPSSNTIARSFFGSSSTKSTPLRGMQDVPQGITACHRGKTLGWKCGSITSIAYKPTWSGACNGATCNSVFVRVSAPTAGGDSGGPWVNGNSAAIGIHKGGASTWSVYSKMYRIPAGTSLY